MFIGAVRHAVDVCLLPSLLLLLVRGAVGSTTARAPVVDVSGIDPSQQAAAAGVAGGSPSGSCYNPLFRTHWSGKSDVRHLWATPTLQQALTFCPAYNLQKGCCSASFEMVLSQAFDRWVAHWRKKARNLLHFQRELTKMKLSKFYAQTDPFQRALFDGALNSLTPVLAWRGTCFDVLLEYMAGMLCFACDPQWRQKIFLASNNRSVAHLHIDDYSDEALWQGCRNLGAAGVEMETRVADSMLAKSVKVPTEDLSMFSTKITVSEHMARLGLFAMRGPSEKELVVIPDRTPKRLQALPMTSSVPQDFINPVRDGRLSGFRTAVFPKRALGLSCSRAGQVCWVALVVVTRFAMMAN